MAQNYHVSVKFEGSEYAYHTTFKCHSTDKEAIIQASRISITDKLKEWNLEAKDITRVEIYYYDNLDERTIYNFEK